MFLSRETKYLERENQNSDFCCVSQSALSFHHFPKDETIRKVWLRNVRHENLVFKRTAAVCRRHPRIPSNVGEGVRQRGLEQQFSLCWQPDRVSARGHSLDPAREIFSAPTSLSICCAVEHFCWINPSVTSSWASVISRAASKAAGSGLASIIVAPKQQSISSSFVAPCSGHCLFCQTLALAASRQ